MRKTKIIATIGPASSDAQTFAVLLLDAICAAFDGLAL